MATNNTSFLILSILLLSTSLSVAYHDPSTGDESSQQQQRENPFLFRRENYGAPITTQQGTMRVLQRFNQRSDLLDGIENYRVAIMEINPNTFVLPNHWDADTVCVVTNGRGSVTLLVSGEDNTETHELKTGDVILISSGVTVHIVNKDNSQKFTMVRLAVPVNTPGRFETFFAAGSKLKESYYNGFSDQILQSAFNIDEDQVRMMFQGQNNPGPFVKATQEQIKELSSSGSSLWPFGGQQISKPYNLFGENPIQSNNYGQLYQVNGDELKHLRDLDIQVSYANITQGGMIGPYFNTRATKIVFVVSGNGYFETMTLRLRKRNPGQSITYDRVNGQVRAGDVYVVPAGHPIVSVATIDQNLELLCYEIGAQYNRRIPLAGKNNILRRLGNVAKELSFGIDAKQVDRLLSQQEESWFFPGPELQQQKQQGQQHHGRAPV